MMERLGRITLYTLVYIVTFLIMRFVYEDLLKLTYHGSSYNFGMLIGFMFAPFWAWVAK